MAWIFLSPGVTNLKIGRAPRASHPKPYTLNPRSLRHAFEFRDKSWLSIGIYQLLEKYKCALVIQDSPNWPTEEVITSNFTYRCFHGRGSLYGSCYNREDLESWAEKIEGWNKKGTRVYAFFNNDAQGHAVRNAQELKALLKQ